MTSPVESSAMEVDVDTNANTSTSTSNVDIDSYGNQTLQLPWVEKYRPKR